MDGKTMKHYVNGVEELTTPINFTPQKNGKTSLGVRQIVDVVPVIRETASRAVEVTNRRIAGDDVF